jgi:hypothetical protein
MLYLLLAGRFVLERFTFKRVAFGSSFLDIILTVCGLFCS